MSNNLPTPVHLRPARSKAASYAMFTISVFTIGGMVAGLLVLIDHALKSPQPISALWAKDRQELVAQNDRLRRQVDSLAHIARQVPLLKQQLSAPSQPMVATNRAGGQAVAAYPAFAASNGNNYSTWATEAMRYYRAALVAEYDKNGTPHQIP